MPLDRYRVGLSPAEVTKRSRELASVMVELAHTEENKAEAAAEFNETIKELRERAHELAHQVHSGTEERLVEVTERRNLETGMLDTVLVGTGEVIRSRELTESERQVTIEDLRERREKLREEIDQDADRAMGIGGSVHASVDVPAGVDPVELVGAIMGAVLAPPDDGDEPEPEMVEID